MKRFLVPILCVALVVLSGSASQIADANYDEQNVFQPDPLVFNVAERVMSFSPELPEGSFFMQLSDEQSNAIFHGLDMDFYANAMFLKDGNLAGVTAVGDKDEVVIGVGSLHGNNMHADYDGEPVVSEVYGVFVTAYRADIGHSSGIFFQATFIIDDVPYNVTLWNSDIQAGEARLNEVVSTIAVLRGVDLTVLANVAGDPPSSWAAEQVNAAIALGLVPQSLRSHYTQAITRAEFSALAVALYERFEGEITGRIKFTDTDDVNVEKAAYIGVVDGVGNNRFNPDGVLTREQAAVMLVRLAEIIGDPLPAPSPGDEFSDISQVSSWAVDRVNRAHAAGIMGGIGNNLFSPRQTYTRQQSIVTIMRLYEILQGDWDVYSIRMFTDIDFDNPLTSTIITSRDALEAHFGGAYVGTDRSVDGNIIPDRFWNALERYDDDFFKTRFLVIIRILETSGSNSHNIRNVTIRGDTAYIDIDRFIPEIGTADMAPWLIMIALDNTHIPSGVSLNIQDVAI